MAAAPPPQTSLHMRSTDLIVREPLDYGGFGEVYLCYHVTLGQVVLKTMYTGPLRSEDRKRSLLEEGNIMASLNHERVVKLLGVIMEDRDCSLVMELIPRGNLLVMLEAVSVPMSLKGRIILEILEGMVYLTDRNILHKDIKPENILVDKDFHIKIADLGLATCQTWSKLTKEESRRKSQMGRSCGARGAGTLSYMAPEHLESIHTVSTEKSDVYSFAIVVWVILTGQEPYAKHLIPVDTPVEIIDLMKRCWDPEPQQRPTFRGKNKLFMCFSKATKELLSNHHFFVYLLIYMNFFLFFAEAYDIFVPLYQQYFEQHVENDVVEVKKQYEGPEELIEKMKSLTVSHGCYLTGSLFIQNASGIQIGNNNKLSIRGYDASLATFCNGAASTPIKEAIQKYEDCPVTEEHLEVLRDNIGANWKRCARRLGLSSVEIETIELDSYRYGLPEMVYQMLERWKMKEGSLGCTIGKLCQALEGKVTLDVIQKILDICELSP
ncbi:hypothetical protein WMY93_001290 [Mugilogobius chulae]|uniref:Receptor (TNFRSF)-interacting serine-threonine kinase 1, like n=1 Tax=Mugilogobius chulae TaxID=88201 RepID=A0AAW0Q4F2_9GOBI